MYLQLLHCNLHEWGGIKSTLIQIKRRLKEKKAEKFKKKFLGGNFTNLHRPQCRGRGRAERGKFLPTLCHELLILKVSMRVTLVTEEGYHTNSFHTMGFLTHDNKLTTKWNLMKFWYVVQKIIQISSSGWLLLCVKKTLVCSLRYDPTQHPLEALST